MSGPTRRTQPLRHEWGSDDHDRVVPPINLPRADAQSVGKSRWICQVGIQCCWRKDRHRAAGKVVEIAHHDQIEAACDRTSNRYVVFKVVARKTAHRAYFL